MLKHLHDKWPFINTLCYFTWSNCLPLLCVCVLWWTMVYMILKRKKKRKHTQKQHTYHITIQQQKDKYTKVEEQVRDTFTYEATPGRQALYLSNNFKWESSCNVITDIVCLPAKGWSKGWEHKSLSWISSSDGCFTAQDAAAQQSKVWLTSLSYR